jgi:ligand-binding SRPBCC domain-containing protein
MHPGTLIDYKLRVHGIPLKWRSEITAWEPPTCFVDEQRRGPYRTWIYEHRFEESGKGTLCTDFVRYSVFGGAVINWLLYAAMLRKSLHFEPDNCGSSFARPAK